MHTIYIMYNIFLDLKFTLQKLKILSFSDFKIDIKILYLVKIY